jgi:HEAT repeat protein
MWNSSFLKFLVLTFIFQISSLFSLENQPQASNRNHLLFLIRSGHINQAIESYRNFQKSTGQHDYELIQEMGLLLLDHGYRSSDPDTKIMTTFGAGISLNERSLYILEAGLDSGIPELQLISLNFLSRFQNDTADEAMLRAMVAAHPLIKLETAFILAKKKAPRAYSYAESLMYRFEELTPLFPQFFALIGSNESIRMLKKLMTNSNEDVRIASILAAAETKRDDLLPKIRTLATHGEKAQQEACAYALGILKDESSIKRLDILAKSSIPHVHLAAWNALYHLGKKNYKTQIEQAAKDGDVFAITLLGDIEGSEDLLAEINKHSNLQMRVNAAIALLNRQDPRCLAALMEILLLDSKGIVLSKVSSKGKSLMAYKATPSGKQNFKDDPYAFEMSLHIRENLLESTLDLPEAHFLNASKVIFINQQNDLVPLLTELLEQLRTPSAIALLKEHQQQVGAPLIRNYCNLALYNLKQKGPYADNIRQWISSMQDEDLIRFRPFLPRELREQEDNYQLTPQDNSNLLIASFESFVANHDDQGVDILLNAIQNGNEKNKYALAGLLLRATH